MNEESGQAEADPGKCVGCGLCTPACPQETLKLYRYERSILLKTREEINETIGRENREG